MTVKMLTKNRTKAQLIEWHEQAIRVLRGLTPKQRRLFHMSSFGCETDCGTTHCIGGWLGCDPWFRRRGLKWVGRGVKDMVVPRVPKSYHDRDCCIEQQLDALFGLNSWEEIFGALPNSLNYRGIQYWTVQDAIAGLRDRLKRVRTGAVRPADLKRPWDEQMEALARERTEALLS